MSESRTSRPVSALLLGLAATLAVAGAHLAGLDTRVELQTLDLRFRHLSRASSSDRIVRVAIDDASLDKMGRWPWPREQIAGVVEVLQDCGARAVALDIIMPEPQETRYESAVEKVYAFERDDVFGDPAPRRVFDDDALADVLRKYPNVALPMHLILAGQRAAPETSRAARATVRQALGDEADVSLRAVLDRISEPRERRRRTDELRRAYLRERAIRALRRLGVAPQAVAGHPAVTGEIVPPLVRFAEVISHTGFVTFQPDLDGVVRRIPLLGRAGPVSYPQFALALAAQELAGGGQPCEITADAEAVTLRSPDGTRRVIPVDATGMMLISWPRAGRDDGVTEIPIAGPGHIWRLRKDLQAKTDLPKVHLLRLAGHPDLTDWKEALEDADEAYRRRVACTAARQNAMLYDPSHVPPVPADLPAKERYAEGRIASYVRQVFDDDLLAAADAEMKQLFLAAREDIRRAEVARKELERRISEKLAELRPHVADKICLIGSTATGAADFVPTPVHERLPGVTVHANILNTILSGPFVSRPGPGVSVAVILLAGVAVSLLAATRPVLQAAPLALLGGAAWAVLSGPVAFGTFNVWLPMVGPLAAMAGAFLVVTAYRQLTEERAKRHIRGLFAHALSPQLVDRLIEEPSLASLGGQKRELTCFFSDLAGFTPISERLGERDTVRLLNRYFDRMTEVVQGRCGGYLNKFLGDGIFVFFGAPVLQNDHPARAVRAAIECQEEIARFNEILIGEFDGPVRLKCRIGIATGEVMVGNCGSTQRMDYTAIGDTVNLASRLESANKFFGTRILAADSTWAAGRDEGVLARPLGQVIVVGKVEPVGVWHLAGPAAAADADTRRAFDGFARGVTLYAERKFADAERAFRAARDTLGGDTPCDVYIELCRTHLAGPPGEDFCPAIRLTEK